MWCFNSRAIYVAVLLGCAAVNAIQAETTELAADTQLVLDAPFVLADHSLWAPKKWRTSDEYGVLANKVCDHVSIIELTMNAQAQADGMVVLNFRGKLFNTPGFDKLVQLRFDVVNGEEVAGSIALKVPVEEGESGKFKGSTVMLADAIRSDPASRLKITLQVAND